MKFTLAIPPVRLPQAPSLHIPLRSPKVRIPFLSLFVEPRSLQKWLLMWTFCIYIAFCFVCYFEFEQPRINHEDFVRFGADSPTYWDAISYREEHADRGNPLVSFTGNLLGPVLIGTVFRTGLGVAFFNIVLFFAAVEVACTIPGVDRYVLVSLLALSAETAPALVTLNKEILVLFTTLLFVKYIYSVRRSWLFLALILFVSVFARWEQIALILLFLFLRRKGSIFERRPWLAISAVIAALTVVYTFIARLPHSGIGAFTQYTRGANTIVKLNNIQASFGFPLVLIPKILMNLFGELLRPFTFVREYLGFGWGDLHSLIIIPLSSIALIVLLVVAYFRGMLNPHRPIAFLIIIYLITTAVTPFVQPRYNYFVYVLLCLELARKQPSGQPPEHTGQPKFKSA